MTPQEERRCYWSAAMVLASVLNLIASGIIAQTVREVQGEALEEIRSLVEQLRTK